MDPDTTYAWLTEAWKRFDAAAGNKEAQVHIACEIHDYWDALDQWLKRDGHLPAPWFA